MSCGVGYPLEPCPFKFEGRVTRETCGPCKHYVPPPHILAWCSLWDRDKILCKLPKSDCATCPFKITRRVGRPNQTQVDWDDPESVAKYHKEWSQKNADRVKASRDKFLAAHPEYMKNYYAKNKDRINEMRRLRESSKTKV